MHVRTTPLRVLIALAVALVAMAASATGALAVPPPALVVDKTVKVREHDNGDVSTGVNLKRGDRVVLSASGTIWAGVWFTGRNDPRGWRDRDCDRKFPLLCAYPYMLLKRVGANGYSEVGLGQSFYHYGHNDDLLSLRINDDHPGNGNGEFNVVVRVYR
jgi:hypothetical protein